jgi:hypothetical protein
MDTTLETIPTATRNFATLARYGSIAGRLAMGLLFTVCGADGFLHFLPMPSALPPEGAMALGMAFMKSGYLFQLIAGTELAGGVLLLANRYVPLALVLLAPIVVNIIAFHAFLAPAGLGLAIALVVIEGLLAWSYRRAYRPLFTARTREPG